MYTEFLWGNLLENWVGDGMITLIWEMGCKFGSWMEMTQN